MQGGKIHGAQGDWLYRKLLSNEYLKTSPQKEYMSSQENQFFESMQLDLELEEK